MAMISIVITLVQNRRGVPDAPQDAEDSSALSVLVKSVCDTWTAKIPESRTLAIFLPDDAIPSQLSRENFTELLEHCEDVLDFKRILVCFNKGSIEPNQGIPRVLKCIGFNALHPDKFPAAIDKSGIFAMVYNI